MRHRCIPLRCSEEAPELLDIICKSFPDDVFFKEDEHVGCSFCILTCGAVEQPEVRRGKTSAFSFCCSNSCFLNVENKNFFCYRKETQSRTRYRRAREEASKKTVRKNGFENEHFYAAENSAVCY